MSEARRHFFSLRELLIMAALAALGGVSSSGLNVIRAAVHSVVGSPVGMQFLAGIPVLWPVLAVGLIRKPGAATATALLAGAVELLAGNPHGLFVMLYAAGAGLGVDVVWLLLGGRHHPLTYMLAGGTGAAANVLVLKFVFSLSPRGAVGAGLILLAVVAFASGVLLAGLLGWSLLKALHRAGIVGAEASPAQQRPGHAWKVRATVLGVIAIVVVLGSCLAVRYLADRQAEQRLARPASASGTIPSS